MKTSLLATITFLATTVGCAPPSPPSGSDVAGIHTCPPDGCGPKDPGDPPPPPPKPLPPQPDPAKYRTAYLSTAYIAGALNDYLDGTHLQISHTNGDLLPFPVKTKSCTSPPTTADEQACIDDCNTEPMLTPAQRAQCRANCAPPPKCVDVCSSVDLLSYLRWGNNARAASVLTSPRTCDATTCPACATPMPGPSLDDIPISILPFTQNYGVGPASVDVTCTVNRWTFVVRANITVDATPDALYVTVPGATGSPALDCTHVPDPTVDGFGLQLRFAFPWSTFSVETEASLTGDWHVFGTPIDFLADMSGHISGGVTDATRDLLNSPDTKKQLWSAFAAITAKYASDVTHETFDKMGYIESQTGQLKVTYWVK